MNKHLDVRDEFKKIKKSIIFLKKASEIEYSDKDQLLDRSEFITMLNDIENKITEFEKAIEQAEITKQDHKKILLAEGMKEIYSKTENEWNEFYADISNFANKELKKVQKEYQASDKDMSEFDKI